MRARVASPSTFAALFARCMPFFAVLLAVSWDVKEVSAVKWMKAVPLFSIPGAKCLPENGDKMSVILKVCFHTIRVSDKTKTEGRILFARANSILDQK